MNNFSRLMVVALASACARPGDTSRAGETASTSSAAGADGAVAAPALPLVSDSVIMVSVGEAHACALSASGVAWCWGSNEASQLGNGSRVERAREPARIGGGKGPPLKAIAAGGSFTCALDRSGAAFCWGNTDSGALGSGVMEDSAGLPSAVKGEGASRFTAITAGIAHACAIDDTGAAWCWGRNNAGQLGTGTTEVATVPQRVAGGHSFSSLGAHDSGTCGVTTSGAVLCWGANGTGAVGDGTTDAQSAPTRVAGIERGVEARHGGSSSCALDAAGAIWCWGSNAYGALGAGKTADELPRSLAPVRVSGDRRFAAMAVGSGRGCGIATTAELLCWGSTAGGLLGVERDSLCARGDYRGECAAAPKLVRGAVRFRQVSIGGSDYACGAGTDGRAYCWGRDPGPEPYVPDVLAPRAMTLP